MIGVVIGVIVVVLFLSGWMTRDVKVKPQVRKHHQHGKFRDIE